ncbi:MAG: tRNA (guanosine(46)-N7)-methyltransferase TrmB [Spirochaetia bacterium]|nr:tRNA (guanosine(46)-N7)-methyltransferase TrmB [Spirochaetia bacterium]MCF7941007.1 tRNA (guanosine(46)-N7)-methyltransferase TrmB [Spirochaetia bacterium]
MTDDKDTGRRKIRSFMMRGGRLSNLQQHAIDEHYQTHCITDHQSVIDLERLFGNDHPVIIEIGFGMGLTTAQIAQQFPDTNFLGIEVHRPGIGKLLSEIERLGLKNLKILELDAVLALEQLISDESIDGFHIFFPDPWQKAKHHKRRLIQDPFVQLLTRKLKPGGYLYAVTDWESYAQQMLEVLGRAAELDNPYEGYADPVSWRPQTKFEQKGLNKEHVIRELWVVKKGR